MKNNYSEKILKILSEKRAMSAADLENEIIEPVDNSVIKAKNTTQKARTALKRSVKGLIDTGMITSHFSGQNDYLRITGSGRRRETSRKIENPNTVLPSWDGYWRIVMLDLPESRKSERESLRYLLKKAGFICLKNSVWISPFPFEHMFTSIKTDMGLSTEMMIMTTNTLDTETLSEVVKYFV